MAVHDGHDVLGDLMRASLDHCVKCTICETFCPVSNVTPLFPGPKYVGPQVERFRIDDEPSPDASLDYCSGCGICTQVCPQGVHIAEINTQARAELKATQGVKLRDRVLASPDARRTSRDAGGADRQLEPAQSAAAAGDREDGRDPPPGADAALRRTYVPALGAPPCRAGGAASRRLLPRLRDELLRAAAGGDDRRPARAQRTCGRGAQAGLLRPAAAVERPVRRRPRLRPPAGRPSRALRPRGRGHRRDVDQLQPDAQARGARDPRHERRPGPAGRVGAGLRHLRVPARDARARRAADRFPAHARRP